MLTFELRRNLAPCVHLVDHIHVRTLEMGLTGEVEGEGSDSSLAAFWVVASGPVLSI
jgi:hypothetical protein